MENKAAITRPLIAGEYALILFEFKITPVAGGDLSATIKLENNNLTSLCCPHIYYVGSSIVWNDQAEMCIESQQM